MYTYLEDNFTKCIFKILIYSAVEELLISHGKFPVHGYHLSS